MAGFGPRAGPYPSATVSGASVEALFEGFVSYKNRGYGVWARGGPLTFLNATLFDNRIQANSPPGPSCWIDSVGLIFTNL